MSYLRKTGLLLCLLAVSLAGGAQDFASEKLRKAATMLGIAGGIADCPDGQSVKIAAQDGLVVSLRKAGDGRVEHIGVALFSDDMRTLMPSPVYDFLEFAVLNWKYKINPNTLYLSKVLFRKGSWGQLAAGGMDNYECVISNVDDRLYTVAWQKDGLTVAEVGIPIEYELLSNDNRRVIERDFVQALSRHKAPTAYRDDSRVDEESLKLYGTEGLFVVEGQSCLMPELNQNEYFQLKTVYELADTIMYGRPTRLTLEDVVAVAVRDADHPMESFANLVLSRRAEIPEADVALDLHLSDYHRQQLAMPLAQLTDYCRQQGCALYFAPTGIHDGTVSGILFAQNTAQGYNHLFTLSIAAEQLLEPEPKVQASAYLFIPTINKSGLFGKTPTKKSGAKIYE